MTHALVTFLGRTPKDTDGYRTTRYRFPDGSESEPTAFLGWTLAKRLRPDRLVVLGTTGSMWDFLGEQAGIAEGDEGMGELWESLERTVNEGRVSEKDLAALAPLVSRHVGIEAVCTSSRTASPRTSRLRSCKPWRMRPKATPRSPWRSPTDFVTCP